MSGVLAHFRGIFFAAICAGVVAGGAMSVLHQVAMVPLIVQAEVFEDAAAQRAPHTTQAAAVPTHAEEHGPAGLNRVLLTVLADLLAGIGFALLLSAALALRGGSISLGLGILWGVAGFAVFSLAPSIGLPPELPGAESAGLVARQIWWLATVAATAGGLALLAFGYRLALALVGLALIAAPHVIGAPQPIVHISVVPAELTRSFVVGALATNLVFWMLLGAVCVFFMRRFAPAPAPVS